MNNPIKLSTPVPSLRPDDRVHHPRLGTGRMLGQRQDGSVVVWFDGRAKPDILFPFQLVRLDSDRISSHSAPPQGSGQC
jgi:hypothetical protein